MSSWNKQWLELSEKSCIIVDTREGERSTLVWWIARHVFPMRLETVRDTMSHHSDEGSVVPGNYTFSLTLIIDQTIQKGIKIEKVWHIFWGGNLLGPWIPDKRESRDCSLAIMQTINNQ